MSDRPLSIDIRHPLILKANQLALLTREDGDVPGDIPGFGLFYKDTCYLKSYSLRLNQSKPLLLMSSDELGFEAQIGLTNHGMRAANGQKIEDHKLDLQRSLILPSEGMSFIDTIEIRNFSDQTISLPLSLSLSTLFESMFQIRGSKDSTRGDLKTPVWDGTGLRFSYAGKDKVLRSLLVGFSEKPDVGPATAEHTEVFFTFDLQPLQSRALVVTLRLDERPVEHGPPPSPAAVATAAEARRNAGQPDKRLLENFARIDECDHAFEAVLGRSISDLALLQIERDGRQFTAAGIPWFLALFGRDSLIPAIQSLAFNPDLAAQTVRALAHWQGTKIDERTREAPGKILHELREGELAHLHEVPQTPDYSAVDSTLLFLIAIGRHAHWTGSLELFDDLRANVDRALSWLEAQEAGSERGFIAYDGTTSNGEPVNQSWRDSGTGVLRADGKLPEPPLALVEVQGYAFQARRLIAGLLRRRGEDAAAARLGDQARDLAARFENEFWMEEEGCYCLALEKGGRQVASVTSNTAQVLWTGIASAERARRIADRIMREDMFSGWGVRTLSADHPRFDPLAYQQGSVWPFDNSLIVSGLRLYGEDETAARIVGAMLEAAHSFADKRLPEFISGVGRKPGSVPTKTPRADPVQAWSAGAIPFMLTELLGLCPEGFDKRLRIRRPMLPPGVDTLRLDNLRIAGDAGSLTFQRGDGGTDACSVDASGALDVVVEPGGDAVDAARGPCSS